MKSQIFKVEIKETGFNLFYDFKKNRKGLTGYQWGKHNLMKNGLNIRWEKMNETRHIFFKTA